MSLLGRDDLGGRGSMISGRQSLNKSGSMSSVGTTEEKLMRSQVNIDRKMREDFDRIQKQLAKRQEREN